MVAEVDTVICPIYHSVTAVYRYRRGGQKIDQHTEASYSRELTIWYRAVELVDAHEESVGQGDGIKDFAPIPQSLLLRIDVLEPLFTSRIGGTPEGHRISLAPKMNQGQAITMLRLGLGNRVFSRFHAGLTSCCRLATTYRTLDIDILGRCRYQKFQGYRLRRAARSATDKS
jgi:hypothetical protein